ncbi:M64 family metallopeptidase [Arenimonas daejeonensis]|uniref:M64 family metallopeptidase n=1 Tax=Arenimonas daejeonensis TaxID=370777 RepID=UPI0011BD869E|nr:M64 family metallopeptidase [Arenimonas daejeonensis]
MRQPSRILIALVVLAGLLPALAHATPATLRVDLQHGGDAHGEHYALERVVVEPLPWAGNPERPIDDSNRGVNLFEVFDAASGKLLYSRGYSTVFGEWRTTEQAASQPRSFQESLRFPMPDQPVRLRVSARDAGNRFAPVWETTVDPKALDIERVARPAPATPIAIHRSGPSPQKVDLLLLGDGYAADELDKFEADARRLVVHLFTVSPFKERAGDFNVWALTVPVPVSGITRPSTDTHRASALGVRYDIFGSERYALTLDNRAWRELAQYAPYDVVQILFNSETYGGGGIFGQFSTVAADNDWANYLFVHEFGHHFAGLADEYYTSPVAYAAAATTRIEPWEPNVTALLDPARLKWQASPATPLPTPWPKAGFEAFQRENQARRAKLREQRRPESEMSALFSAEQRHVEALFDGKPHAHAIGAFEGANYEATGYYRPQLQCLMFTRSEAFCHVCQDGIEAIIDLYSRGATP